MWEESEEWGRNAGKRMRNGEGEGKEWGGRREGMERRGEVGKLV